MFKKYLGFSIFALIAIVTLNAGLLLADDTTSLPTDDPNYGYLIGESREWNRFIVIDSIIEKTPLFESVDVIPEKVAYYEVNEKGSANLIRLANYLVNKVGYCLMQQMSIGDGIESDIIFERDCRIKYKVGPQAWVSVEHFKKDRPVILTYTLEVDLNLFEAPEKIGHITMSAHIQWKLVEKKN